VAYENGRSPDPGSDLVVVRSSAADGRSHSGHNGASMKKRSRAGAGVITAICLSLGFGSSAHTQTYSSAPNAAQKGAAVATHATGTFDVKVNAQAPDGKFEDATLGRMTIDKQFHGDLEATSLGQMLTAGTDVKGSAGYVAIERVTGTLHGRSGSFVLQHSGTMTRGALQLTITVVPDSGTAQLAGLTGKMAIKIADGKHSYDFEYTLPEAP